ncbi:uncharacterized protein LOC104898982 [Beta vulgaris subsp. vulgaris]|uniref:uncharacterized protein LOC104898982 n=1 Tax=Beta vulgaris subsp. vulgaris TaxID=3555 RepID=UPI00053FBF95|nr:uncharacterized protein LOC104898982 [Beta vulgaris subsp. vulgaris]
MEKCIMIKNLQIEIKPWQLFTDKQHLRDVVRDYAIQSGFSVVVDKANNFRWTVTCSSPHCAWRLHASRLPDGCTWAIKSIKSLVHTCASMEVNNPMVNVKWAARVLLEDIRANNDIPAKSLNKLLFDRYNVEMLKTSIYKSRALALSEIHGGHDVSYAYLPQYCNVIRETNPQSAAFCAWSPQTDPERPSCFSSIFISFKGALDGLFSGCRSLVGVDGAHLKGNFGGVLLSAVALDGNNELFPFAWGIDLALSELWPKAGRRYCCKHLCKTWKRVFPGPLMFNLFWKAAGAYSKFTFKKAMEQLQKTSPAALVWLSEVGEQSTWSKHAFKPHIKSDVNKTNFVENSNATLGIDRCKPVLTLLEGIRRVTMVRLATRRQACEDWERE